MKGRKVDVIMVVYLVLEVVFRLVKLGNEVSNFVLINIYDIINNFF